jgi:hypothetical protein
VNQLSTTFSSRNLNISWLLEAFSSTFSPASLIPRYATHDQHFFHFPRFFKLNHTGIIPIFSWLYLDLDWFETLSNWMRPWISFRVQTQEGLEYLGIEYRSSRSFHHKFHLRGSTFLAWQDRGGSILIDHKSKTIILLRRKMRRHGDGFVVKTLSKGCGDGIHVISSWAIPERR